MMLWEMETAPLQWGVAIAVSLIAVVLDLRSRRIPNLLTGPALLAGLIWATTSAGFAGLCESLAGAVLIAAPYVILFALAGGGAGDAKLMGALGAWLGLVNGVIVLLAVALSGVILAVVYAVAKGRVGAVLAHVRQILRVAAFVVYRRGDKDATKGVMPKTEEMVTMPYGAAIFSGVCIAAGAVLIWHT